MIVSKTDMHRQPHFTKSTLLCLLGGAALLLSAPGCGNSGAGPETFPVTGVVTLEGQPVGGATLQFVASADEAGAGAGGQAQTAADGAFTVESTFDKGKTTQVGLPAGVYKVTVTKLEAPAGARSLDHPPKNTLPPKYAMAESTTLSATVTADGENKFDFPL